MPVNVPLDQLVRRLVEEREGQMMDEKQPIPEAMPVACLAFLPRIVKVAQDHGYALTVHGTLARDFDFVAVPWTDKAAPAEDLVEAIRVKVGGFLVGPRQGDLDRDPKHLPHGRLAWSIHLGGGPYIDLSVMPRMTHSAGDGIAELRRNEPPNV